MSTMWQPMRSGSCHIARINLHRWSAWCCLTSCSCCLRPNLVCAICMQHQLAYQGALFRCCCMFDSAHLHNMHPPCIEQHAYLRIVCLLCMRDRGHYERSTSTWRVPVCPPAALHTRSAARTIVVHSSLFGYSNQTLGRCPVDSAATPLQVQGAALQKGHPDTLIPVPRPWKHVLSTCWQHLRAALQTHRSP